MSLVDTLMQSLGGDSLTRIGQELGTDETTARDATGAAKTSIITGNLRIFTRVG